MSGTISREKVKVITSIKISDRRKAGPFTRKSSDRKRH